MTNHEFEFHHKGKAYEVAGTIEACKALADVFVERGRLRAESSMPACQPAVKVVYIAGRYRGPTAWDVDQNITAAKAVAARVWAAGFVALCPHTNSAHMEGAATNEQFLAGTLELLRRCDAVVLVPGWESSRGTLAEVAEANRLGLPVFDPPGDSPSAMNFAVDLLRAWAATGDRPPTVTPPARLETDREYADRRMRYPDSAPIRLYVDDGGAP